MHDQELTVTARQIFLAMRPLVSDLRSDPENEAKAARLRELEEDLCREVDPRLQAALLTTMRRYGALRMSAAAREDFRAAVWHDSWGRFSREIRGGRVIDRLLAGDVPLGAVLARHVQLAAHDHVAKPSTQRELAGSGAGADLPTTRRGPHDHRTSADAASEQEQRVLDRAEPTDPLWRYLKDTFSDRDLEIIRRGLLEDEPADDVARAVDLRRNNVYQIQHRARIRIAMELFERRMLDEPSRRAYNLCIVNKNEAPVLARCLGVTDEVAEAVLKETRTDYAVYMQTLTDRPSTATLATQLGIPEAEIERRRDRFLRRPLEF